MPGQLGHDLQGLPGVDQIPTEGVAEGMCRVIREADFIQIPANQIVNSLPSNPLSAPTANKESLGPLSPLLLPVLHRTDQIPIHLHPPGLPAFPFPDGDNPSLPVDVLSIQADHLRDPKPCLEHQLHDGQTEPASRGSSPFSLGEGFPPDAFGLATEEPVPEPKPASSGSIALV